MSWHYYCPITSRGRGQKYKYWEKLLCDDILAPLVFNTAGKRAQEVTGGNIMTEVNSKDSHITINNHGEFVYKVRFYSIRLSTLIFSLETAGQTLDIQTLRTQ